MGTFVKRKKRKTCFHSSPSIMMFRQVVERLRQFQLDCSACCWWRPSRLEEDIDEDFGMGESSSGIANMREASSGNANMTEASSGNANMRESSSGNANMREASSGIAQKFRRCMKNICTSRLGSCWDCLRRKSQNEYEEDEDSLCMQEVPPGVTEPPFSVEENEISEEALNYVQSNGSDEISEAIEKEFWPLIKILASGKLVISRMITIAVFPQIYKSVSQEIKAEIRRMFCSLCKDKSHFVRHLAAKKIGDFAEIIEETYLLSDLMPLFVLLANDKELSVQSEALESVMKIPDVLLRNTVLMKICENDICHETWQQLNMSLL